MRCATARMAILLQRREARTTWQREDTASNNHVLLCMVHRTFHQRIKSNEDPTLRKDEYDGQRDESREETKNERGTERAKGQNSNTQNVHIFLLCGAEDRGGRQPTTHVPTPEGSQDTRDPTVGQQRKEVVVQILYTGYGTFCAQSRAVY